MTYFTILNTLSKINHHHYISLFSETTKINVSYIKKNWVINALNEITFYNVVKLKQVFIKNVGNRLCSGQ